MKVAIKDLPLTPDLVKLLDYIYAQRSDFITRECSVDGKLGCRLGCDASPCEPSPSNERSVVLLPGERAYIERRLKSELRFRFVENDNILAVRHSKCPYNVEGKCTLGENGQLRPFACRIFPIHVEKSKDSLRVAHFFLNVACDVSKKSPFMIKEHAKQMRSMILALWTYLPDSWWRLWSSSRSAIQYVHTNDISFELEFSQQDVVDYSSDRGIEKLPAPLAKSLCDEDCPACTDGVDHEDLKLGKRSVCRICSGPRFWNMELYKKLEVDSRTEGKEING